MNRMGQIAGGLVFLVIVGILFGTPVSAQPIKAPAKITTPGVYELSEDARGITDIYGISIECSNVVLDGGNHFLGGEQREKSVGVYVNQYGGSITNVTVKNLILEKWETGINYKYVKGQEGDINLITRCDIVESDIAIHVEYSDFVQVSENKITECPSAINIEGLSTNSRLEKNVIRNSGLGVGVTNCKDTTIEENNINTCTVYGLEVIDSENTTIIKNGIGDNKYAAIRIDNSRESNITGNTLSKTETGSVLIIGNEVRYASITNNYFGSYESVTVDDVSSEIVWNSTQTPGTNILGGPYLGGNYWGSAPGLKGFSDTAPDEDGFGIADKPYQINEYNIDYLPLTHTTATKAPEEQVSTPVTNESPESSDNLTTENVTVSTPESVDVNISPSSTPVSAREEKNTTGIDDTENASSSKTNITPVMPGVPAHNQTENQAPVQNPPSSNNSIMNSSITNAYPADNSSVLAAERTGAEPELSGEGQQISLNLSTITLTESIPDEGQLKESEQNNSANQSIPTPVGYIVFNMSESESQINLTTASGNEVSLDPVQGRIITIPVPVEGVVYTSYQVRKDGFALATGNISPYPASGQTITIPVTLIPGSDNTTISQNLTSLESLINTSVSTTVPLPAADQIPENSSPANQVPVVSKPVVPVNVSSEQIPVKTNNSESVVVANGVVADTSIGPSHVIKTTAGTGGSIFPGGDVTVLNGGSVSFLIEPDEGRSVTYLVIDGVRTGSMSEYRFINVTTDHTIAAGYT